MSKKNVAFIVLLTITAMIIWIIGEVLIVAVFNFGGKASVGWTVIMIVVTLAVSIWRGLKDDNDNNSRKW
jgi:hypothetical protein